MKPQRRHLTPGRMEIARLIMEARRLAIELNEGVLDYLLESAFSEILEHDAAARAAVLDQFPDLEAE